MQERRTPFIVPKVHGTSRRRRSRPMQRYTITVPIEYDDDDDDGEYTKVKKKTLTLFKKFKQLPTPLRLALSIVLMINLYYFLFFSNHHGKRSLTQQQQQLSSLRTNLKEATQFPVNQTFHQEIPATAEPKSSRSSTNNDAVLVVIVSDRISGIVPTVSSILKHTLSKPVDLVLIGDHSVNEQVRVHFNDRISSFVSLTVADVQADLVSQGIHPIWTWPEWGSSRAETWANENTLHMADWDGLETHAHELNHLRFYLPLVKRFRSSKYLYFLDDDIMVQRDLGHAADATMESLDPSKGLVTPCNIWVWNSDCHHFEFQDEHNIKPILEMPSLYGDRQVCQSETETHCYPTNYWKFIDSVMPNSTNNPKQQKAWNFGFSLFALDNWRDLDLTGKYETVMKESYRKHVFPETSLSFGLGVAYIAFAGTVECWNDDSMKVRDGFSFIEWARYEKTLGKDFFDHVDVVHYTGPHKPWAANTTIEPLLLEPWLNYMEEEQLTVPDQLPSAPSMNPFTLLAGDRVGAQWIMAALDSHPAVCASGENDQPSESGFPVDVLMPEGTPWFPVCSVKRGCSFAFIHDAVLDLVETMDLKGRTGVTPARCSNQRRDDPLGDHLPKICNFVKALRGNYDEANIAHVWFEAFRNEDHDLLGCRCPRGTTIKGLKVYAEWIVPPNFPFDTYGPPAILLDETPLIGSKVIRLKRRNLWARFKSTLFAQQSNMYHVTSVGEKKAELDAVGNVTVSIEQMLRKFIQMTAVDKRGDEWARKYASEVLWLDYEDCCLNTKLCFERIFQFLGVDESYDKETSQFESPFSSIRMDRSLDHITNKGAVIEALTDNGYGQFIDAKNSKEIQLLIYDESEGFGKSHLFHQEKGVDAVMFGRGKLSSSENMLSSKFLAAIPLLQDMARDTLVVLSASPDVRINFPGGNDGYRYEAIYEFRAAFEELTRGYPGAVVASAEKHCCASALTHGTPGDFFNEDGKRKERSCISGQAGCEWAGDEKALPWQSFMQKLALEREATTSGNHYLDASLIAGKAGDLLEFIRVTDVGSTEDDRAVLTDFMHHSPNLILLDYNNRLFGTNREGLHSETNQACPYGVNKTVAISRQLGDTRSSLFMHSPRDLGCMENRNKAAELPFVFPRWDSGSIDIKPILDHIDRVASEEESLVLISKYGKKLDYSQGPEVPYFVDEHAVWTSRLIRDRTDEATLKWRASPTETLLTVAHKVLKRGGSKVEARWPAAKRALQGGGFPYWSWYGDFKVCNFHNHGNSSIPILTTAVREDCNHAFPMPSFMLITGSQLSPDNWRGKFRDAKEEYPWKSKRRQVVWRGSLSEADREGILTSVRWRVNKLIHELGSELYDVGLTSVPPWVAEKVNVDTSIVGGLRANIEPMEAFQNYMAILDMDGNSWSPRFSNLLCYNSVVVKVEPKYLEYFYPDLKPWTHYIPVKDDLSDLHENVAWALDPNNEDTVKDIISSANEWCAQRLVPRGLAYDLLDIFESYVRLLDTADLDWQNEWTKKKSIVFSATSSLDVIRL